MFYELFAFAPLHAFSRVSEGSTSKGNMSRFKSISYLCLLDGIIVLTMSLPPLFVHA
jgi:hypothetical protein